MDTNFLLNSETAKALYQFVKELPIVDYHNHLSISDIKENKRFTDIYDLWIAPDPYKHRVMRMCGVCENLITGDAPVLLKFKAWCETLKKLIGHPLYIWSKMELEKVFGICDMPDENNAEEIYNKLNSYLEVNEITPSSLLRLFNVELACPCMSLTDDVAYFENTATLSPSLRGDDITNPSKKFIDDLSSLTGKIENLGDYKKAIVKRLEAFIKAGLLYSDHALDNGFKYYPDDGKNENRFKALLKGKALKAEDSAKFFSYMLTFMCNEYAKYNLSVQLHIGAQRHTSSRLRKLAGAAGGFAAIGNSLDIASFNIMLDTLEQSEYSLPKLILFTLNPADNAMISVLSGSYSKDGSKGLITQGPAWWWCDHKFGIEEMLESNTAFGLLSNFVGMTTDSRSFLSMVRHDYFRRILCDWLAKKYDNNELLCDINDLKNLLNNICYKNSKKEG